MFPKDRLNEILIGACFDRAGAVNTVIATGDNNDFCRLQLLPDSAADLEAIGLRHEQIAEDQVRPMLQRKVDPDLAISGFQGVPSFTQEKLAGGPATLGVIFD